MKDVDRAKKLLTAKSKRPQISGKLLSLGSTLENLACSGSTDGGIPVGEYVFIVGDTDSGKTWVCMTIFAEANLDKTFADYRFIYDGPEGGAMMDLGHFFGRGVAERLEHRSSETVEQFYYDLDSDLKSGEPFIRVLDSMDALVPEAWIKKFKQKKKASEKESAEEVKGSYGTDKARLNSENIRRVLGPLRKSKSILVIISQTRDNIGFGSMFDPKTRSGGKSLSFYACIEIWTSVAKKIKETRLGKKRQLGILSKVRVKRSRLTGKDRTVEVPIYHGSGIDDVGSMVDWLIEEGHWSGKENTMGPAPEFVFKGGTQEKLIQKIEAEGLEPKLRELVGSVWQRIEDACVVKRKARYT